VRELGYPPRRTPFTVAIDGLPMAEVATVGEALTALPTFTAGNTPTARSPP
jgi:hypothetical protein